MFLSLPTPHLLTPFPHPPQQVLLGPGARAPRGPDCLSSAPCLGLRACERGGQSPGKVEMLGRGLLPQDLTSNTEEGSRGFCRESGPGEGGCRNQLLPSRAGRASWGFHASSGVHFRLTSRWSPHSTGPQLSTLFYWTLTSSPKSGFSLDFPVSLSVFHHMVLFLAFQHLCGWSRHYASPSPLLSPFPFYPLFLSLQLHLPPCPLPSPHLHLELWEDRPLCKGRVSVPWI